MLSPEQQALVEASWRGRLLRSLPPDISIYKSAWISILRLKAPDGEPQIDKVHITAGGYVIGTRVIDRNGRVRPHLPLFTLWDFIFEVRRMWLAEGFTMQEMQECYNMIRHWLRHDYRPQPDKDKGLIPGFVYTGPSQSK